MLKTLVSIYIFTAWALWLFLTGPLLALALITLPRRTTFYLAQAWVGAAFAMAGIKVRASGMERVDWNKAQVFMANHESLLDHLGLLLILPGRIVGVEKSENFKVPIYGALARAWGNIPIVRNDPVKAREAIQVAVETLQAGVSILVMPEGTRTRTGEMNPFKKGGFHLAKDAASAIVPFTINGAYELNPGDDWRVQPGTMEFVFGDAISTDGYAKDHLDPLVERVRGVIVGNMRAIEA